MSRAQRCAFSSDEDFRRVRALLLETYPVTPTGFNWEIRRWDGWRYHRADPAWRPEWERTVRLWETADARVVGAVHPEGQGDAHLQLHADYRHLEEEMVAWAEEHLAVTAPDSVPCPDPGAGTDPQVSTPRRRLSIFVFDYDAPRRHLLEDRGYVQQSEGGVLWRMRLPRSAMTAPDVAPGYTVRGTRSDRHDDEPIAKLLNRAFHRDTHTVAEFRAFALNSPSYEDDLNLLAVAADGALGAMVGVTLDERNCRGTFEPVCTDPDHRRRGLARSLMVEGLRRMAARGTTDVYVETGDDPAANRLYAAVGFTEAYRGRIWRRDF